MMIMMMVVSCPPQSSWEAGWQAVIKPRKAWKMAVKVIMIMLVMYSILVCAFSLSLNYVLLVASNGFIHNLFYR